MKPYASVCPSVHAKAFGESIVLLDFRRGDYFALDMVGAEVWRCIEGGDSLEEICAHVCELFDVAPDAARKDIESLIDDLVKAGLASKQL